VTERLRRFCLELHPEKTRLIEFGRFASKQRSQRGLAKNGRPRSDLIFLKKQIKAPRNHLFLIYCGWIRQTLLRGRA
jgi:hypothetical protein